MCCTNPNKICLLSQVVVSLAATVAVSTLPYPVSTLLVTFSSLELVTFTTFTCSVVAPNLRLTQASLALSVILVVRSIFILIGALAIDLDLIQVGIPRSINRK